MMGTVYRIENVESGTVYIGSTSQEPQARWGQHLSALRWGRHHNPHLQFAWQKYGEAAFGFAVLAIVPDSRLTECEQIYLDEYRLKGRIYNTNGPADCPWRGQRRSEEVRQRMRERTVSKETRRRISEAGMGHAVSLETRRRIGEAQKGRRPSESTRRKLREARAGKVPYAVPHPAFLNERTGERIAAGINLVRLCRERGINHGNMWTVAHGQRRMCQGWILDGEG